MNVKHLVSITLIFVLVMVSCTQEKDQITYELTLSASKPIGGTIVFSEIKYSDGKTLQTLTNQTDGFSTKLAITPGFPIDFSAKGTITNPPPVLLPYITYRVDRITNGYLRYTVCDGQAVTGSLTGNTFVFDAAFKKTFTESECR